MPTRNTNDIPFMTLIQQMEAALDYTSDVFKLIELISAEEYVLLRDNIINTFQIGELPPFDIKEFGCEVEFGDISDAVRNTTFNRYPPSTSTATLIELSEREEWCRQIVQNMDLAAANN
ncbi:hypothetical protein ACP3V3_17020 [Vibrio sp. PNB22_3_1]